MALQRDTRDWLRSTLTAHARQLWSVYGFLLLCSVLFWYLRLAYWRGTYEPPFSDIAGYVATADNIVRHFFFGLHDAHQTYYTPVTPALIAIAKLIAPVRFELAFRVLIQAIVFVAALAVVREIALLTGKKWLAASFLFIVAICRPSIFWSLKLSTEPVSEALLYATAGTALATLRTGSWRWAGLCGVLALCLGLNRPGFLPGTMLIPLAFLIQGFKSFGSPEQRGSPPGRRGDRTGCAGKIFQCARAQPARASDGGRFRALLFRDVESLDRAQSDQLRRVHADGIERRAVGDLGIRRHADRNRPV